MMLVGLFTMVLALRSSHSQLNASAAPVKPASQMGAPVRSATEDQIREYLSLLGAEKAARNLMVQMVTSMRATAAPYYPPSFWQDVNDELLKMDLVSTYVKVYQRYLSQEEMAQVLQFYRSPAGKDLLTAQPLLVRDAQVLLREKSTEIGKQIYLRHKDEIEAAKLSYERQQKPASEVTVPK